MGLATQGNNISVYKACIKDTKSFNNSPLLLLFSNANKLNPELIPKDLPILTRVEEMMITHIYIHLQVVHVRGQQY
jgi:hypothetical protein